MLDAAELQGEREKAPTTRDKRIERDLAEPFKRDDVPTTMRPMKVTKTPKY